MTLEARVIAHLLMDKPAPPEWIEYVLADRFKWTLAEIRALTLSDGLQLLTMMAAEAKANKTKHGAR